MKLQILQENLNKAINIASRFTTSRAQLPILGNILLKADKSKLTVSSTNLEMSISVKLGAKVEEVGEICVPSKIISDLVGNLQKETLSLESKKEQLVVSSSSSSSSILGMNSSDFPKVPENLHKEKALKISSSDFSEGLSKALFATSLDETRPILTGVLFEIGKDLTLVATDGFRLSRKVIRTNISKKEISFILPKNILSEISRDSEEDEILFEIQEKEKQVVFEVGNRVFSSRLLEGSYPDYKKIIPKNSSTKVTLDKEDFLRAVKLLAPFARDNANIVKVKVLKGSIKLTSESSQSGVGENTIDAKVEGDSPVEIAFNYRFLEDFVGSVKSEEIVLELTSTDKAGVFTDPSDKDFLHLIMPVKIQG